MNHFSTKVNGALRNIGINDMAHLEITLHDILRLMPEIGLVLKWGAEEEQHVNPKNPSWKYSRFMWQIYSNNLVDAFMEEDYAGAEQYIMSLIEKK